MSALLLLLPPHDFILCTGRCTIWQLYTGTLCYITTFAEKSNSLHEWTPCEGWSNCSRSRVRLSNLGATFEPVVLHLICSCEASDQWDTTAEEFWQSGITLFPCRNYSSIALLMYQICIVQLWLILIIWLQQMHLHMWQINWCRLIVRCRGDWGVGSHSKSNHIFP
jgi:hypothetical protein